MNKREILGCFAPILILKNKLLSRKYHLRILMYHDIPSKQQVKFEEQIIQLKKAGYQFAAPSILDKNNNSRARKSNLSLLLTFDDAFESNYKISKILDKYGIQAIFFVPSNFIELKNRTDQISFIQQNLFLNQMSESDITDEMCPLSWSQIKDMEQRGHCIAAHTCSHAKLSKIKNKNDLNYEVMEVKKVMEYNLGHRINHFAYPFGDINSVDASSLKKAASLYSYVFSGVRGFNESSTKPYCLRRDQISVDASKWYLRFIIEGGLDFKYYRARKRLDQMIERN